MPGPNGKGVRNLFRSKGSDNNVNAKVKHFLWHVGRLLIVVGLVAFVVSRTDMAEVLEISRNLLGQWWLLVAALVVMSVQAPLSAYRWRMLLSVQGVHITFMESLRLTYVGWFFNNWMPGATGGDFIKAYYIAQNTHKKTEVVTVVFLDRVIGLVAMCMMGAAAVAVSLHDPNVRVARYLVTFFLAGSLLGGIVFYSQRLRNLFKVSRFLKWMPLWPMMQKANDALLQYRYHKKKLIVSVACSWIIQGVGVLAMWWLAFGLGSAARWDQYFVSMPVIWIGWSLIPVPGGFGVAENLTQALFAPSILGVATVEDAKNMALAMILAYRVVQAVATIPGAVLYLGRRATVSPTHMREEMEASEADA
jgi:glycosyltransferase 2 family protein